MSEQNQEARNESQILNEMLSPIMNYCKENSIPAVFTAITEDSIVKATMGNDKTTAYLLIRQLDGDEHLMDEFEKQLSEILKEDE